MRSFIKRFSQKSDIWKERLSPVELHTARTVQENYTQIIDAVRLTTTFSCKGLDFPVVLFLLDNASHTTEMYDEQTSDKINRNLIYTAITRSLEILQVFTLKNAYATCIKDLQNILENSTTGE